MRNNGQKKEAIRQNLLLFLKNPNYNGFHNFSKKEKIIVLLKVLALTYICLFIVNIPVAILKKLELISEISMKTEIFLRSVNTCNLNYKPYFLFSTILFVPLLEELSFRLFLVKFRVRYFIISISLLSGMIIKYFLGNIFWIPQSYILMSVVNIIYILIISVLMAGGLCLFKNQIIRIEEFWNKNIGFIIYSVAILFSLGHIINLSFKNSDLIFMPLILLPFFVSGLSFSYIRIKLGIAYSIILHFIFLLISYGLPELLKTL